jgi:hypothetical protein
VAFTPVEVPSITHTPFSIFTSGVSPSCPSAFMAVVSPLIFQYFTLSTVTISIVGVFPSSAEI